MSVSSHGPEPCASAMFRQSPASTGRRARNFTSRPLASGVSVRRAACRIESPASRPPAGRCMSFLRGFEKRLEGLVEGFFARALPGGGVQPVELGKRMVRAMEEGKTAAASGATYVPNAFAFNLSHKDHEPLSQISSTLRTELSAVARRAAASEGWRMVGPPEIHIVEDTNFKAGTFGIAAQFVE